MRGRIVFDLDGTMAGFRRDGTLSSNKKLVKLARKLRAEGNRIILWTFGNRTWWREVRRTLPELSGLFHEVYTRDEMPGHITKGVRQHYGVRAPVEEYVKDIRLVDGDVLIDNEPAHYEWAKRHGLSKRYILVPTYGVA